MDAWYDYFFGNPDTATLKQELSKSLLFHDLSSTDLDRILKSTTVRSFEKGQHVFFEGDPGSALYVILRGRVNIMQLQKKKPISLVQLTKGMFFGEVALVEDAVRSATARVEEDTTLLCLFRHDFDRLIKHHPRLGVTLLLRLSRILASRLRTTNERLAA